MPEDENINQFADYSQPSAEENKTVAESLINNDQTSANMEVHHPHHITHKKKFREYLLEFFMLFLAVFLGFVAENIRENSVEKEREKQFIKSFVEDLRSDTAAISRILIYRETKREKLDSLMFLLSTNQIKGFENQLYFFGRILIRSIPFQSNDRTITQLKNSGSLRLIRSEQAADSMISYQKMVEEITTDESFERTERIDCYPILSQMFDPFVFDKMVNIEGISRPVANPPLRTYDRKIFLDFAFYVHVVKGSMYNIENRLEKLKEKAKNTIAFLQKEYHLENE